MAQVLGPDFIRFQVHDLARSRRFYTETLGFVVDPRFDTPDFVLFKTTSVPFGIGTATGELDHAPGWGVALWLDCDDVDALHSQLEAAGAIVLSPPSDSPFGRAVVFADPDGYRVTANHNPWDRFPLGGTQRGT